ncbi:MAG: hypothetical protein JW850_12965 [Thermoflexales bacterium]|nr:hypothetical protein [Thermoflexales bacterium]
MILERKLLDQNGMALAAYLAGRQPNVATDDPVQDSLQERIRQLESENARLLLQVQVLRELVFDEEGVL